MLVRKRYYFWLIKAYIKKWRKTVFLSLFLGVTVFYGLIILLSYYVFPSITNKHEKIGYYGSYTIDNLPLEILESVSYGLTRVDKSGKIKSGVAASWKIENNGKRYTFFLKNNLFLSSGVKFDIKDLPYSYKDTKIKFKDNRTVVFDLKNSYAPFLSVLERPIIINKTGFGKYKIEKVKQNSVFVESLVLVNNKKNKKKIINFYPTSEALKTAFQLGEINFAKNFSLDSHVSSYFKSWKNVKIHKKTDYRNLHILFFNTNDKLLSNKKIRQSLVFSLPDNFKEGERTFSYIPKHSIFYTQSPNEGLLDLGLAKSLLESEDVKNPKITIHVSEKYKNTASIISKSWANIGIKAQLKTTEKIPVNFQVFLTSIKLPKDPDMYTLWHSSQPTNISHYKNVRIDKLLEDGRQETKIDERIRIYADLQKYLLDDVPAVFLYFPYTYSLERN